MNPVTTKIENSFAKIEWEYPEDGSADIVEYEIQIKQKDGTYRTEDYYCNGAQTAVLLNRYCFIPVVTVLRADPYSLVFQDPIIARVKSRNIIGWSINYSLDNSIYATVQVEPTKMVMPIKGPATDQTQIEVLWVALVGDDTGGSTITSYNLQWDTDGTET